MIVTLSVLTQRITSTTPMIRKLVERFSNFVPLGDRDQIEEQFSLYQTTRDLPEELLQTTRVDLFWGQIGKIQSSTGKPFGLLSDFAKCVLSIPHQNADFFMHKPDQIRTDHCNQLHT